MYWIYSKSILEKFEPCCNFWCSSNVVLGSSDLIQTTITLFQIHSYFKLCRQFKAIFGVLFLLLKYEVVYLYSLTKTDCDIVQYTLHLYIKWKHDFLYLSFNHYLINLILNSGKPFFILSNFLVAVMLLESLYYRWKCFVLYNIYSVLVLAYSQEIVKFVKSSLLSNIYVQTWGSFKF